MSYLYILPAYISWHYGEAYREIVRVWTNFVWFVYNFFSMSIMVKTFFSPWMRLKEKRLKAGFHGEDIAEVIVMNIIMRAIGAMMRFFIIVIGTCFTLLVFWGGLVFFVLWTLLPFLCGASFMYGLSLFIS